MPTATASTRRGASSSFTAGGRVPRAALERFIVVLNFSSDEHTVTVPFPDNGQWRDLLNESWTIDVRDWRYAIRVGSHWGHVFFQ